MKEQQVIHNVKLYKQNGLWVFDDPERHITAEALVCGIDIMLTELAREIPYCNVGARLLFSDEPFPLQQVKLMWESYDTTNGGNWYFSPEFGFCGWLCPVLYEYYICAPAFLYAGLTAVHHTNFEIVKWYAKDLLHVGHSKVVIPAGMPSDEEHYE